MEKEELELIYNENTNAKAAKKIGVSVPTLLKMVNDMGIEKKGSGRPYKGNAPLYISYAVVEVGKILGPEVFWLFNMLLMDKIFSKANWKGLSSIPISDEKGDYQLLLEKLYKSGYIGEYKIIEGKISTSIKNRKSFIMTEKEYLRII